MTDPPIPALQRGMEFSPDTGFSRFGLNPNDVGWLLTDEERTVLCSRLGSEGVTRGRGWEHSKVNGRALHWKEVSHGKGRDYRSVHRGFAGGV